MPSNSNSQFLRNQEIEFMKPVECIGFPIFPAFLNFQKFWNSRISWISGMSRHFGTYGHFRDFRTFWIFKIEVQNFLKCLELTSPYDGSFRPSDGSEPSWLSTGTRPAVPLNRTCMAIYWNLPNRLLAVHWNPSGRL